jgi:hypothetical protein
MAVIVDFTLLMICLGVGGLYLLIISLLWNRMEKFIPTTDNFPENLLEERSAAAFISTFIVELIFFVFIPALIYAWFYTVIPFSGIRGGVSVALVIFILGVLPLGITILLRIRLPVVFLLYHILGMLVKIAGTLAIIGYLYSL